MTSNGLLPKGGSPIFLGNILVILKGGYSISMYVLIDIIPERISRILPVDGQTC